MGRGGRSEEDLSIAADIVEGVVEEGKDGEESLARSVGLPKWTESAAAAQGEAAWGGDCVTARSHVKCPICACFASWGALGVDAVYDFFADQLENTST